MDKVVHFEIPVDDLARAKKFYGSIFGWKMEDMPMEDGTNYTTVQTVAVDEKHMPKVAGAINGGMALRGENFRNPVFAINVPSIDERVKQVEKAGGKVVMGKMPVKDMGYYAYVTDSEGNVIGLWEDMKKM